VLGSLVAQLSKREEVARTEIGGGDGSAGGSRELATGLNGALQGGYTLARATRDIAPMETALFSMIDHIESLGSTDDGTTASRAPRSRP
jgi:hypothetical protein